MKKPILILSISLLLFSCNNASKNKVDESQKTSLSDSNSVAKEKEESTNFDLSKITESTAELGVFPYLNAPDGYKYNSEKNINPKDIVDFDKEYFAVNGRLILVEGKSFKVEITKDRSDGKRFNSLIVDKSYEEAILALGGVSLNNTAIPKSELERIGNKELVDKHYGYSIDFNLLDDVRCYVIKTKDNEVWIQYSLLNDESGSLTILEKGNLNTVAITTVTANQMKIDIDKNGKAVLNINFDTDLATLKPDGVLAVKEITTLLTSNPTLKISIEGHTDNTGTSQKNQQLSSARAKTVLDLLVANGIEKTRLKAVGFGASKPLVANDSDQNKAKNRRVELVKF